MKALPRAVLLDLDDTILRYSAAADESWSQLCTAMAPRLRACQAADLLTAVKRSAAWYWSDAERHRVGRLDLRASRRRIVREALVSLGIQADHLAEELADQFTVLREELVRPFEGALETLQALRERQVGLGLLTNGSAEFQRKKIERFGLGRFFGVIVIEGEFGIGKPDKRVFAHALDRLTVAPSETWMIGDNLEWDVRPALELGMAAIWVDHLGTGLPAEAPVQPTRTIRALPDLFDNE
jgi:putative hydrolase of the HAD superfamily